MYRMATWVKAAIIIIVIVFVSINYDTTSIGHQKPAERQRRAHESHQVATTPKLTAADRRRQETELKAKRSAEVTAQLRNESWDAIITTSGLTVTYASLDRCGKPTYVENYQALCYNAEIHSHGLKLEEVRCTPNHYLLGIRKCGTTDVVKWFQYHAKKTEVLVKGHRLTKAIGCPQNLYGTDSISLYPQDSDLMSYSPGDLLFSRVMFRNRTHMAIETALQYVAFLSVPGRSKFLITLRNPTDRLISYLHHAHSHRWIFQKVIARNFDGQFLHNVVVELVAKVLSCLEMHGELACTYMYDSTDGNLQAVVQHGFYIVYLQELFNFVPRQDVYINHLEEYSKNQLVEAGKMMKFFGKKLEVTDEEKDTSKKHMNTGRKKEVLPETIELLNNLYRPFNRRLANFLADDKWLYDS